MPKRKKLSEAEWRRLFEVRRSAKQGHPLSKEDLALIEAAFREDSARYEAMTGEVFDSTVPFGSTTRWRP